MLTKLFNNPILGASVAVASALAVGLAFGEITTNESALAVLGKSFISGGLVAGLAVVLCAFNFVTRGAVELFSRGMFKEEGPTAAGGFLKTAMTGLTSAGVTYVMVL